MQFAAVANLVHMTTTQGGTGNLVPSAVFGKQTIASAFGTGDNGSANPFLFISNREAYEWEIRATYWNGTAIVRSGPPLASSNAGYPVNFSAGVKDITNDIPASYLTGDNARSRMFLYDVADTVIDPESFPSGENQQGKVWQLVPNLFGTGLHGFALRHPKIAFGPSGLTTGATGNIALTTDVWTPLYSGVPLDGIGFRSGMVAYIPKGRWGVLGGFVTISTPSIDTPYYVRVMQGNAETNPTTQPNINVGSPVRVGGGPVVYSPGSANRPFHLPFIAADIQYAGARDHAAEIWAEVKPVGASSGAGSALASTGDSASGECSQFLIIRWDGQDG